MIIGLIDKLLLDPKCYSVISFIHDDYEYLLIILEDDSFEDNIKFIDFIERYIKNTNIDIDYLFFDKTQRNSIFYYLNRMGIYLKEHSK